MLQQGCRNAAVFTALHRPACKKVIVGKDEPPWEAHPGLAKVALEKIIPL